jgi:hypothetical protein
MKMYKLRLRTRMELSVALEIAQMKILGEGGESRISLDVIGIQVDTHVRTCKSDLQHKS